MGRLPESERLTIRLLISDVCWLENIQSWVANHQISASTHVKQNLPQHGAVAIYMLTYIYIHTYFFIYIYMYIYIYIFS